MCSLRRPLKIRPILIINPTLIIVLCSDISSTMKISPSKYKNGCRYLPLPTAANPGGKQVLIRQDIKKWHTSACWSLFLLPVFFLFTARSNYSPLFAFQGGPGHAQLRFQLYCSTTRPKRCPSSALPDPQQWIRRKDDLVKEQIILYCKGEHLGLC